MIDLEINDDWSPEFRLAVDSLNRAQTRNELSISQLEAPAKLATHAIAFSADVDSAVSEIPGALGTGRFILLWDPEPQDNWASRFRVICFAKSPLETDIGSQEDSSSFSWSWLIRALEQSGAKYAAEAGTTTRIISNGYGAIANQPEHAELEIRASWSPLDTEINRHIEAWMNLVCIMSGFSDVAGVQNIEAKLAK